MTSLALRAINLAVQMWEENEKISDFCQEVRSNLTGKRNGFVEAALMLPWGCYGDAAQVQVSEESFS